MKKKYSNYVLIILWLGGSFTLYSCKRYKDYYKTDRGIIVSINRRDNNTEKLRLQVISDHIIRVTASPDEEFSRPKSLMISKEEHPEVHWEVHKHKDSLVLCTSALQAIVSLQNGRVQFKDASGHLLLAEEKEGRTFIPDTVEGVPAYHLQQKWNDKKDAALYGLGGNQLGYTDIRDKDVALIQRNSEAYVPFLVSPDHFGILWDNNAITYYGDPHPYRPLDSMQLYNVKGERGGLTATYVSGKQGKNKVVRKEKTIDYEFLKDLSHLPKGVELSPASAVTWEGYLVSPYSGMHTFRLYWGGYIKVWINGHLLFPSSSFAKGQNGPGGWRQPWNPAEKILSLEMQKGKKYPVKIKWLPDGGESFLSLKWAPAETPEQKRQISLASEMGQEIDYYFIFGQNMDSVISGYRRLTGKAPIMPLWAYGFWQSREHYSSQKEILDVVKEFRKRKIPLDNIVQDWFYWEKDKWGNQKFDAARYPNPGGMIDTLHKKYHAHFMISVWPKFYTGTKVFQDFWDKGWLYKKNVEDSTKDWVGYVSTFYDAFNKDARKAFWGLVNMRLFSLGVDAWWLDATEPDILSNVSIKTRKELMEPTALEPSTRNFNAYSLEQAKAFYNGQREASPGQRVFILTRSAFAGSQRYAAANWSGDIGATWWDMKNQIATGISYSLSGNPYWTMDIGGFATERRYQHPDKANLKEWREQFTRWFQFGAFCPLFRAHGQYPYREPFNVAPEGSPAYESMIYYDKLRYRLLPYIYSLAGAVYLNDYTLMRGLAMDFPGDSMARNTTDEYMFGPGLLVNPVYTYGATTRKVYLPDEGTDWYNLYNGKYFKGGQTIAADAPYSRIPVFVKAGSIIPFGPALQYTQHKPADTITLFVYAGRDGHFNLYEDDGITNDYEKGSYSIIPLEYHETGHTLRIGERKGSFEGMLKKRLFKIKWITPQEPKALDSKTLADKMLSYDGQSITIKIDR